MSLLVSMSGSLSSIDKFIRALENLNDRVNSFDFACIDEITDKIRKEIDALGECQNHKQEVEQKIDDKMDKADKKIDDYEQKKTDLENKITELKGKITDTQSKLASLPPTPAGALAAAALTAELAALNASLTEKELKLKFVISEIERLKKAKEQLEQKKNKLNKIGEEIDKAINDFEEGCNEIDQCRNEVEESLQQIGEIVSKAIDVAQGARDGMEQYLGEAITKYERVEGRYVFENRFIRSDAEKIIGIKEEERAILSEETGYSNSVLDRVRSLDEARFYKSLGLVESNVGDRKCLIQPGLEYEKPYPEEINGEIIYRTNLERMSEGRSPILTDGQKAELHHVGQKADAPLAELSPSQHRYGEKYKLLHTTNDVASVAERHRFNMKIKPDYWRAKAQAYIDSGRTL